MMIEESAMQELRYLLQNVYDTYDDFVSGIVSYVRLPGNEHKVRIITDYIKSHPKAGTVEIIKFVLDETGFFESVNKAELEISA